MIGRSRPKPDRRYRCPISTEIATFDLIDCQVFGEQNHLRTESLRTISSQHFRLSHHHSDISSSISTLWPNEVKIMSI